MDVERAWRAATAAGGCAAAPADRARQRLVAGSSIRCPSDQSPDAAPLSRRRTVLFDQLPAVPPRDADWLKPWHSRRCRVPNSLRATEREREREIAAAARTRLRPASHGFTEMGKTLCTLYHTPRQQMQLLPASVTPVTIANYIEKNCIVTLYPMLYKPTLKNSQN